MLLSRFDARSDIWAECGSKAADWIVSPTIRFAGRVGRARMSRREERAWDWAAWRARARDAVAGVPRRRRPNSSSYSTVSALLSLSCSSAASLDPSSSSSLSVSYLRPGPLASASASASAHFRSKSTRAFSSLLAPPLEGGT